MIGESGRPPKSGSGSSLHELELKLEAWREQTELAVEAIGTRDFDAVERALAVREGLRAGIADLVSLVGDPGAVSAAQFDRLDHPARLVSGAERTVLDALESERAWLEHELATVRREPTPSGAYQLPEVRTPHHLNIIR